MSYKVLLIFSDISQNNAQIIHKVFIFIAAAKVPRAQDTWQLPTGRTAENSCSEPRQNERNKGNDW